MDMAEPPPDLIANLVDNFLGRFADSGYFFIEPFRFRQSALLPLPFGHRDRPSPALLSAVYLWGTVLSQITPHAPYTADAFLLYALQNIPHDLAGSGVNPQLVLDTIQAEVLLSFYYLHMALPVQGRYHSAHTPYPRFALGAPLLPPPVNAVDETLRINAFWAVVILNNYWVGAEGSPSAIPFGIPIDTPWPGSSSAGATITKFLNGNDPYGSSPVALLAKASILLERIIASAARTVGSPDPAAFASLDHRLHLFQAALPPLPGPQTLVLARALVELAIVRLHAPHARTADPARTNALAAAGRVVASLGATNLLDGAHKTDPMFGPVYATVARVYMDEIAALTSQPRAQPQALRDLEARLGSVMNGLASLAAYSPIIDRCFVDMRATYAGMTGSG
ncbi:hypothetical protein FB451DRAFT_1452564 [Mycena latifolia]|nr:hypothetical protein FB451DRAFT_1452564 [Mycena latifolia]